MVDERRAVEFNTGSDSNNRDSCGIHRDNRPHFIKILKPVI
jgi:hypothetical protein